MYELLDKVNSPADIKSMSVEQLRQLCSEVRSYMIECCSKNPGHLASSLGAVELIIGLHYVFDTPNDKIVFDVGHQSYAHKIITGRREAFRNFRTADGISGFPKMSESPYDAFGVGHSSTSISAALGLAEADRMLGNHNHTIAFIGDGALTGGMAYEGINNAGVSNADLLIILNDNNQSIDSNKGGLHEYLLRITTSTPYNRLKNHVWNHIGDNSLRKFIQRWIKSLKSWFVKKTGGDLFESFGIRYFGPVDGNDVVQVVNTLERIKNIKGPRIIHCITTKGKGYVPAETDPVVWHAPGRFNPETGERIKSCHKADRYQDVFGRVLTDLAHKDRKIVGVTPAMATGCGMNILEDELPEQFFDVGIEEEHAVTFSAGLAAGGMKPFCNIYSAFSQRSYDQIIHDVALQGLPVVLCFDRAGLVGEDGATHHGIFDMAAYRSIPGATVCSPKDEIELKNLMHSAAQSENGPYIIRYPRGMGEGVDWKNSPVEILEKGSAEKLKEGSDIAIIAIGHPVNRAMEAAAGYGGKTGVFNFRFLKPLDEKMLKHITENYKAIITVEDGTLLGGLYGALCEYLSSNGISIPAKGLGVPDKFIIQAPQSEERSACGIDKEGICKAIEEMLKKI